MVPAQVEKPWDFSQVFGLINSLSTNDGAHNIKSSPRSAGAMNNMNHSALDTSYSLPNDSPLTHMAAAGGGVGLGDFGKIWQFLGTPNDSLPAIHASPTLRQRVPDKIDYTSDGAVYLTPGKKANKGIQWRDEAEGGDLTDVAPTNDDDQTERLTKKQRQKRNKRERQRLAEAQRTVSDVDDDLDERPPRDNPAHKASLHTLATESSPHRPSQPATTKFTQPVATKPAAEPTTPKPQKPAAAFFEKRPSSPEKKPPQQAPALERRASSPNKKAQHMSTPDKKAFATPQVGFLAERSRQQSAPMSIPTATPATEIKPKTKSKKEWPVADPFNPQRSPLTPSSVQPPRKLAANFFEHTPTKTVNTIATPPAMTRGNRSTIEPKIVRSGEDRNWALLLKLVTDFYEDRASLVKPANLSNHSNNPKGIHIFVDASNIFIGFHEQLKRARGIPQHHRVPQVDLSFDALVLLMERRRPVAKRVLVGSKPHISAFDTAREIGYECSILDKVLKAKELTERQKYFQEMDQRFKKQRRGGGGGNANNHNSTAESGGSGSETNTAAAPVLAPEKYIEQGVDEIIHLKMMESVVDAEEPTTIVLATGDAAQAEYSQGFMKMAERALKKGWRIELVSWSKNISQLYKKASFRDQWGDRFRVVELDDYAEELLDM